MSGASVVASVSGAAVDGGSVAGAAVDGGSVGGSVWAEDETDKTKELFFRFNVLNKRVVLTVCKLPELLFFARILRMVGTDTEGFL